MHSDAAHHELLDRNFQGKLILVNTIPAGLNLISSGKFAVRKGDTELPEKLNQGLLIVKTNGKYDRIYDKWLSLDDPWRKMKKYLFPTIITVIVIAVIAGFWLLMLQLLVRKRTRELAEKSELLQQSHARMETLVHERTMKLKQSNQLLQAEITEHKQAEEKLKESEKRYRELSIVDALTQLYNSRHFYHQLEMEVDRANRYGHSLTLLLLDLDDFKRFNDAYGHIEGDQVLLRLGQVVKRCLRQTDSAYRYGGEEFTILLPMTTDRDSVVTVERIRTEFKKEIFSPEPG
ncbi:MAG: diguanylate cyclase [Desulfobacterales bacterium]|nr:diguanylate cyclase [Desulfobacterales bacterium]